MASRGDLSLVITVEDATGVLSAPAATARVLAASDIVVQTSVAGQVSVCGCDRRACVRRALRRLARRRARAVAHSASTRLASTIFFFSSPFPPLPPSLQIRETQPGTLRRGTPDVSFKASAPLAWALTPRDWLKLRASTPVIKLAVLAVPKPGLPSRGLQPAAPILLGFALFDARGMEAAIQPAGGAFSGRVERALPLRGAGAGAVLRLTAEICPAAPLAPLPVLVPEAAEAPPAPAPAPAPAGPLQGSVAVLASAPPPPPAPAPTAAVYEDAIQIGTPSPWDAHYTLGVTLSGLSLTSGAAAGLEGPFWLSYKVFGVLIQTDAFPALAAPTGAAAGGRLFPPVRDTFTLRATPAGLAAFLSATPPLRVYLCRPGQALAVAELPFAPLATALLQPALAGGSGAALAVHAPSPCGADLAGSFTLAPMAAPAGAGGAAASAAAAAISGQVTAALTVVPQQAAAPVPAPPVPAPLPPAATSSSFSYSGGVGHVQPVVAEHAPAPPQQQQHRAAPAALDDTAATTATLDTTAGSAATFEEPAEAGLLYLSPLALAFGRASLAVAADALPGPVLAALGGSSSTGAGVEDAAVSLQVAVEYKGRLDVRKVLSGSAEGDVESRAEGEDEEANEEEEEPLTQTVLQAYRCGSTVGLLSSHGSGTSASSSARPVVVVSSAGDGAAEEDVLVHVPTGFIPSSSSSAASSAAAGSAGLPPNALPLKPFGRLTVSVKVGALGVSQPLLEATGVVAAAALVAAAGASPAAAPTLMVPLYLCPEGSARGEGASIGSIELIVTKDGEGSEDEEEEAAEVAAPAPAPAAPAPAPAPAPAGPDARDELIARLAEEAARWKAAALRREAAVETEAAATAVAAPAPAPSPAPAPAPAPEPAPAPAPPAAAPVLAAAAAPAVDTDALTLPQGGFSLYPQPSHLHRWRLSMDVRAVAGLDTGVLGSIVTAAVAAVEAQAGAPGAGSILVGGEGGEGSAPAPAAASTAPSAALVSQQPRLFVRYTYNELARAISEEAVARKLAAVGGEAAASQPPVAATTLCLPQVRSTPAVPTPRATERLLPKAFCSVSFPGSPAMLSHVLSSSPLPVEVWTSDATGSGGHSKDMRIGATGVDCGSLTPVLAVTAAEGATAASSSSFVPATGPAQFRCGVTHRVFTDLRSYAQHAASVAASLVTGAGGDAAAVSAVLQADVDARVAHSRTSETGADLDTLVAAPIPGLAGGAGFVFPALAALLEGSTSNTAAAAAMPPSLRAAAAAAPASSAGLAAAWEALVALPARTRRALHKLARPVVVRLLDVRVPVAPVPLSTAAQALGGAGPADDGAAAATAAAPPSSRLCSLHVLAWLEDHGPMPEEAMAGATLPPPATSSQQTGASASAPAADDAALPASSLAAQARVDVFSQLGLGWLCDDAERGEEDAKLAPPAPGAPAAASSSSWATAPAAGGAAAPTAPAVPRTLDAELTPAALSSLGEAELDALISRSPALRTRLASRLASLLSKEEAALEAWRRESEHEWADRKRAIEDSWRREAEVGLASRAAALERAWADRETERQSTLAIARESVAKVESRLRRLVAAAEAKEREAERARDEAVRAGDAKATEMAALARRLKEDADHASSLVKQREAAAAARVAEANEEAATMRARYTALVGELEATKLKLAAGPDAALRDALAAAAAENRALTDRVAGLEKEGVELREQLGSARVQALRLAREVAKLRAEARDREAAEAERLRVAWLAREERLVLDGDRAALRDIRRQVEAARVAVAGVEAAAGEAVVKAGGAIVGGVGPEGLPPAAVAAAAGVVAPPPAPAPTPAATAASSEVARLKAERRAALATGGPGMSASHPLIQDLDRRIALAALEAK